MNINNKDKKIKKIKNFLVWSSDSFKILIVKFFSKINEHRLQASDTENTDIQNEKFVCFRKQKTWRCKSLFCEQRLTQKEKMIDKINKDNKDYRWNFRDGTIDGWADSICYH